jgi:hypothetical protein
MSAGDLTRWNRAGLKRLQYVDANAAVHYERLRAALRSKFGELWPQNPPPPQETDERRRERLQAQYAGARGDWGEELARALARACHVLTGYIDAYANESALRTATQWDNVRRLVEMLGYHPAPPASASTPLILLAKEGKRGRLDKGFAVKHSPPRGGAPVVFETLADLEVDPALNALRLAGHGVSPELLTGATLELEARVPGLKLGEPVVLEREGFTLARLIAGIQDVNGRTELRFDVELTSAMGFKRGETLVHVKPADRLEPLGPAQTDATAEMIGDTLVLAEAPRTLADGAVVYIADGVNAYFRRVAAIDGVRVRLDRALAGPLRLDRAWLSTARAVPVARVNGRIVREDGMRLFAFKAAGDLSDAVGSRLIADVVGGTSNPLREFRVVTAKYQPPMPADPESGCTTFTVEDPSRVLDNPQGVYLPAVAREWKLDSYLFEPEGALLPKTLTATLPKAASPGDFVVLASGARLAWAKLDAVASEPQAGSAQLVVPRWYTRASGRFYLAQTRLYARFGRTLRPAGAQDNGTEVGGARLSLASRPALLAAGRRLWIEREAGEGWSGGREATVTGVAGDEIVIDPPLGAGFTIGNTVIRGNVVAAGHGERQNERILGSGNAALLNQSFVLNVAGVSFVADATFPAGVRADLDVMIEGGRWTEVATLDASGPGDAHYVVRMTEEGHVRIGFGDGTRGRRLPSGANNVRVRYRLGSGLAGNLPPASLEKPARPNPLIDKVRQRDPARGGGDMEGVASLKRNAPASVLTLERAVSAADYAHLAAAHAAVWRARAFALPSALRRPRIEVVVVPAGGGTLGERLKATLRDFLAAHSLPGVQPSVTEYGQVRMHVSVKLRVVAAEHDPDTVKAQASARLASEFALEQRDIGADLYLSEVYAVVEAIAGVRNSSCTLFWDRSVTAPFVRHPAGQRIEAGPREVVFLDPQRSGALHVEVEEFEL